MHRHPFSAAKIGRRLAGGVLRALQAGSPSHDLLAEPMEHPWPSTRRSPTLLLRARTCPLREPKAVEVKAPRKTAKCAAVVSIRWLHFVPFLLSTFVELGSDGLNFVGEAAAFYAGTADSSVCDRGAAALASLGGRGAASWGSPLGRGSGPEPGLVAALSFWLAGCGYGFCSSGPQFLAVGFDLGVLYFAILETRDFRNSRSWRNRRGPCLLQVCALAGSARWCSESAGWCGRATRMYARRAFLAGSAVHHARLSAGVVVECSMRACDSA